MHFIFILLYSSYFVSTCSYVSVLIVSQYFQLGVRSKMLYFRLATGAVLKTTFGKLDLTAKLA